MQRIKKSPLDALNVLRIIAALCVFVLHTSIFSDQSFFAAEGFSFLLRTPAWGGVWIFFVLGGYLSGKSFVEKRYPATWRGAVKFYCKKFRTTIIPTVCFIFFCCIMCYQSFVLDNPGVLRRFLTFTYNGNPGVDGIGACWYVFTMVWLWFFTPVAASVFQKTAQKKQIYIYILMLFSGAAYRLCGTIADLDWYTGIYTHPIGNIDLYFGGMLTAYILDAYKPFWERCSRKKWIKVTSAIGMIALLVTNSWLYNQAYMVTDKMVIGFPQHVVAINLYRLCYPSAYLLMCSLYFFAFDGKTQLEGGRATCFGRVIELLAAHTFEFYLFHSLILNRINSVVIIENSLQRHGAMLLLGGAISAVFASAWHKVFSIKRVV